MPDSPFIATLRRHRDKVARAKSFVLPDADLAFVLRCESKVLRPKLLTGSEQKKLERIIESGRATQIPATRALEIMREMYDPRARAAGIGE